MGDPDTLIRARIHYFGREKYFHSMQMASVEGIKRFSGNPAYKFYYGIALVLEGRIQEGMRELDPLQSYSEVMLGAIIALIHAHKACITVDKEAVAALDSRLKEERKRADDQSLYYAGLFLLYAGKPEKAKDYSDRLLKINPNNKDGLALKGWIELFQVIKNREGYNKNALQYFDTVLKTDQRSVEALFGKAKYYELCGNFDEANEILSVLIVVYQEFVPALIEKLKIELCLQDWDQAIEETAVRILSVDPRNIEALRYKLLDRICRFGDYREAETGLRRLYAELEKAEPKNAWQFLCNAQLFSRICGRNERVLEVTNIFAEKAASIDPNNDLYMAEVGYQRLLRGRVKEALRYYKTSLKLDESSITALSGIIACQIQEGHYDSAKGQLDFLKELQTGHNKSEILYMSAILCRLTNNASGNSDGENALTILNEAVDFHFRSVRGLPFGIEYLKIMNPDYVSNLVKEYLLYAPSATPSTTKGQAIMIPQALKKTLLILEPVTKACPGLKEAHFLVSKAKFLSGDIKSALSSLQHLLDKLDPTDSEAYLLMAQIRMYQGDFASAQQNLEVGLSYNFQVRDHPMYHLINARVQKENGYLTGAIKTLKKALEILDKGKAKRTDTVNFTSTDKVSLYLELADSLRMSGQQAEAAKTMQIALNEYKGTPEEIRITVANADLALEKGDIENALDILRSVGPEQPYFVEANEKMADIYLKKRKDKRMYAQCYRKIVENFPTPPNYALLGDAYMRIQEPERALDVYEQALKKNPRDPILAAKMGQALQRTHQYGKAINYYREAVKNEENNDLRYDMADLQMKLKQYEKAEKTVLQALESELASGNDMQSLEYQAKFYSLLATIREKQQLPTGNSDSATKALMKAKDFRSKILKRVQVEKPDSITEQRQIIAEVCHRIAEYAITSRDYELAIQRYKEALQYYPEDEIALCSLARLYLTTDDLDQCQYTCMTLLKKDGDNEEATVMMADLAFRKNDYETATFHFKQLLDKRPDYWVALSRLVEVMRRTGKLEDVPEYLAKSKEYAAGGSRMDPPGLNFCQAMYEWYSGNAYDALKLFNKARQDSEWDQRAVYNMIEICLNPDNQMLGGEVFESNNGTSSSSDTNSEESALSTAEKLLKELKPRLGQQMISYKLLQGMLLLSSRNKTNVEKALQDFMSIASNSSTENRENVGAVLGMATAYQLLKQTPKARNQLKRVAKHTWNFEDAEYLERCWLLLADIYIQGGKYDMATELIRKVFLHNKSSTKAYEYMGYIMEKESSYKDAANNYEQAWKYSNKSNPVIGYKLAFNYMKAKRYTDAIDISHEILIKFPNYPKVKKEILEKSRDSLKR